MNTPLHFLRILFFILSIFFMTLFMVSAPGGGSPRNVIIGILSGAIFGISLIGFDKIFRKYNLRSFNIGIIGLFVGYLMGQALVLVLKAAIDISSVSTTVPSHILEMIEIALFLFGTYLGSIMTLKASDEFYVSIPFVKFATISQKKKDLIIDSSALADVRLLDLARTGILDHHLILPRFLIKEFYSQVEFGDELIKSKAKKSLDVIKKLEQIECLSLRFHDTDFPEVKELQGKLVRLARLLEATILSADLSKIQISSIEGIQVINIHSLSNALKPLTQTGELLKVKVQRHGKEPRQGIGYLEDGTMVVINGGGKHLGVIIEAQVLSVKHTSSGRMIFCNACDEEHIAHNFMEEEYDK